MLLNRHDISQLQITFRIDGVAPADIHPLSSFSPESIPCPVANICAGMYRSNVSWSRLPPSLTGNISLRDKSEISPWGKEGSCGLSGASRVPTVRFQSAWPGCMCRNGTSGHVSHMGRGTAFSSLSGYYLVGEPWSGRVALGPWGCRSRSRCGQVQGPHVHPGKPSDRHCMSRTALFAKGFDSEWRLGSEAWLPNSGCLLTDVGLHVNPCFEQNYSTVRGRVYSPTNK